jgi:hypothetical protein
MISFQDMALSERDEARRIVNLLTALVVLTGALAIGLAIGSVVLWREYRGLRSAVAAGVGQEGMSARSTLEEVSRRQAAFSAQLATSGKETARQVAEFERRAAEIRKKGGGPINTASKAVEIAQLMMDQSLLALKQTATGHDVLRKISAPLAAQRELIEAERDEPASRNGRRPPRPAQREPPARAE